MATPAPAEHRGPREGSGEQLVGPQGPHAAQTGWDSVTLELRGDGCFVLELWRFYESWDYLPEDDGDGPLGAGQSRQEVVEHLPRAMRPREVEEVRVSFTGLCFQRPVPTLRLRGFQRHELNQDYAEDPGRLICGLPSWWSADGQAFIYFSEQDGHWCANAVRLAGGDGVRAVECGGRRPGAGFAHSGAATLQEPTAALFEGGWYEEAQDASGLWQPASAEISVRQAVALDFHADRAVVEERHLRGEEGPVERQVDGPLAFHGWRPGGSGTEVRLVLPTMPKRHTLAEPEFHEVQAAVAPAGGPAETTGGTNLLGDPDALLLRPAARL